MHSASEQAVADDSFAVAATPAAPASPIRASGLTALSAVEVAALVARGELTAEEVALAHLDRIAECDPHVRALVWVDGERALYAARRVDRARTAGRRLGPLAGVPVVVKDNVDIRRQTTSCGSHAHGDVVALRHAAVVARLLNHDAVLLGRANMDELALGASTQTSAFGPTSNPHDLRRSPGGSSGGSAAAVAAGLATLAVGTDTGGSIREPAAQCGVAGMAPSPGLVPLTGVIPFTPDFDRVGPLARTTADAARMLATMAGRPALASAVQRPVHGMRVGLVDELQGTRNQPGVRSRLAAALNVLRDLGIQVVEVSLPDAPRSLDAYFKITSAECVSTLAPYVTSGLAGPEVVRRYEVGRELLADGTALALARDVQRRLTDQARDALSGCDLLLSSTMPTTAPFLESIRHASPSAEELADPMAAPYTDCWTTVANLAGLTSLSVPAGMSPGDGMPVGVLLSAAAGRDATVLALGAALERALT